MKKEIKLARLKKKILTLQNEYDELDYNLNREQLDSSEQYIEAAQPVAPAVYEQGE